jgi:hypothetical protein
MLPIGKDHLFLGQVVGGKGSSRMYVIPCEVIVMNITQMALKVQFI